MHKILVSPADAHLLESVTTVDKRGYARVGRELLHRIIMWAEVGQFVDHINGNPSDCRRENLRFVTHQQNMMNRKVHAHSRTGVKGVAIHRGGYRARIRVDGKQRSLGTYSTIEEAANAYKVAALKHFGEFARVT